MRRSCPVGKLSVELVVAYDVDGADVFKLVEPGKGVGEQGDVIEGEQGFWGVEGECSQTGAVTAGKRDDVHGWLTLFPVI